MKSVQPTVDLVIAGAPCGPDSDPIMLDNDAADALIAASQAVEADDLDRMKIVDLQALAEAETVALPEGVLRKADLTRAIRDHRAKANA